MRDGEIRPVKPRKAEAELRHEKEVANHRNDDPKRHSRHTPMLADE